MRAAEFSSACKLIMKLRQYFPKKRKAFLHYKDLQYIMTSYSRTDDT
jgi:hypothetical protein